MPGTRHSSRSPCLEQGPLYDLLAWSKALYTLLRIVGTLSCLKRTPSSFQLRRYLAELQRVFDTHASEFLPPEVAKRGLKVVRL